MNEDILSESEQGKDEGMGVTAEDNAPAHATQQAEPLRNLHPFMLIAFELTRKRKLCASQSLSNAIGHTSSIDAPNTAPSGSQQLLSPMSSGIGSVNALRSGTPSGTLLPHVAAPALDNDQVCYSRFDSLSEPDPNLTCIKISCRCAG